MNSFIESLSGWKMTLLSGLFLAISFVLYLTDTVVTLDPIWGSIIISGIPIAYNALTKLFLKGRITSSLLITIAMVASVIIGEYFAAGEIAFIMAIGEILEDRTVSRAQKGIHNLINLAPSQGRVLDENGVHLIPVEEIEKGQILKVLPGETIPVDGVVVVGITAINQSVITGESLPVDKVKGDSVFAGTLNGFGAINIEATKVGEDSSLQKLIRLVQDAEANKAPTQRIVDKWAAWLVPMALLIALITYFATGDIERAVTVLVVFCPCALALATPTSIMAAIGQATKHGVLIKSGEALELMGKIDTIAFDKTGTLTHGELQVTDILPLSSNVSEQELLSLTAAVESGSEHPIGKAILRTAASTDGIPSTQGFRTIPGKGISASVNNEMVYCGNLTYMEDFSIDTSALEKNLNYAHLQAQGKALVFTAKDNQLLGIIALADTIREESQSVIAELKEAQLSPILLTGDNQKAAQYLADKVGMERIYSELLPEQKLATIKEIEEKGHTLAMVGDGVNDAPALKAAHVGIAMGGIGSDIALDAADIALMGDDLSKLPYLQRLSKATLSSIKLNISLAMLINFAAIVLSIAGILIPATGALVHNAGSVLVVLNATLLYDRNFQKRKKS